jgi:hypothetical protein
LVQDCRKVRLQASWIIGHDAVVAINVAAIATIAAVATTSSIAPVATATSRTAFLAEAEKHAPAWKRHNIHDRFAKSGLQANADTDDIEGFQSDSDGHPPSDVPHAFSSVLMQHFCLSDRQLRFTLLPSG